ncbi:hypothetical protein ACSBR1_015476 [Camellia fascicularis]
MTVQKGNGLWCDNRALKGVKPRTTYVQEARKEGKAKYANVTMERGKQTYAQVLYESVIVRLQRQCSEEEFRKELTMWEMGVIKVIKVGGRDLVVSFESAQEMKEKLSMMRDWIQE